jgi:catechol 2,3-dioxygenase-like lactoylglutathione lyase family enzyme
MSITVTMLTGAKRSCPPGGLADYADADASSRREEGAVRVSRLDHLVLTVASIDATVSFYTGILGMTAVTFGAGRTALTFGTSKINLHEAGRELEPRALHPTPGSADVCFIVDDDIRELITELTDAGIAIEEGPVERTGATGPIVSCYLRDPDQNLIELSNYTP